MAKAKAGPRQTTRKVRLDLTEGEADMLLALLAFADGHATESPAKYVRRVTTALEDALGYDFQETDAFPLAVDGDGITFARYDGRE